MAPEIRFNALGIPYLVEFANVSFRPPSRSNSRSSTRSFSIRRDADGPRPSRSIASMRQAESPARPASHRPFTIRDRRDASESRPSLSLRPTASCSTLNSDRTLAATASSETLAGPSAGVDTTEDHGLYIRLASQLAQPPSKLSEERIARLKYRIAKAVMAAGMDTSPSAEVGDPMAAAGENGREGAKVRASISSIHSEDVATRGMPGSLFRGTYGQVMTALKAAGLATVPCKESGVHNATRLGALFVARPTAQGGVEFTKLTLWA
ncbi:hypothetical protein GY45DRAFT_27570 [Cubamyces sp. BRFM 1775]|nr:hypothetical protein GY45DRAFT_27570 [Cubamyces sp. BRFM 1775]